MNRFQICTALTAVAAATALISPTTVLAQSAPTSTAAAASAPTVAAPSSPAKKEMVQRLVALQQSAIDGMTRNLVEGPARQLMAAAEPVLQTRVPPEKREAVVKQIQEEVRKYIDSALPIVRDRASKLTQSSLAAGLDEKFTEDELRQIVAFYESPVNKKLQQTMPEISNAMAQKLVSESRPQVDPKVKALEASVAKALGVPLQPAGAASGPASTSKSGAKPDAGGGLKFDGGSGVKLGKPPATPASKP